MKRLVALIILLISSSTVYGDGPPCWCDFTVFSANKLFKADIEHAKADSLKEPWEREWSIRVYKNAPDTLLLWQSDFFSYGYSEGKLSNDGQLFVYVNYWLRMETDNQLVIHSQKGIKRLSGKDLELDSAEYPQTASHQIWMDKYYLFPDHSTDTTKLIIETLDAKKIELDLTDYTVNSTMLHPQFIEENEYLKIIGLAVLIILGIGIAFILIKKQNITTE